MESLAIQLGVASWSIGSLNSLRSKCRLGCFGWSWCFVIGSKIRCWCSILTCHSFIYCDRMSSR